MPWLNALDNVALGLRIRGLGKAERSARARPGPATGGPPGVRRAVVAQLSRRPAATPRAGTRAGGRAGLPAAREPFGALDALTRERMQVLLLDLWKQTGKGLFLITHTSTKPCSWLPTWW